MNHFEYEINCSDPIPWQCSTSGRRKEEKKKQNRTLNSWHTSFTVTVMGSLRRRKHVEHRRGRDTMKMPGVEWFVARWKSARVGWHCRDNYSSAASRRDVIEKWRNDAPRICMTIPSSLAVIYGEVGSLSHAGKQTSSGVDPGRWFRSGHGGTLVGGTSKESHCVLGRELFGCFSVW